MLLHYTAINSRTTPHGSAPRRFLLDEVVYSELETLRVAPAGKGFYAVRFTHQLRSGMLSFQDLAFTVPGITITHHEPDFIVIHAPRIASLSEATEEVALAFVSRIAEDWEILAGLPRWEYLRAEEAAADAAADYLVDAY